MENKKIVLQLTTEEINLILEGLGSMPFVKVYALVGKIQQQAADQLDKPTKVGTTTESAT